VKKKMTFIPENPIDKGNLVLDLLAQRQQALGANIANVNTPGYVRQDVDFNQYLGAVESPLETKLSKTLGPSPMMRQRGGKITTAAELVEMQKNMLFYLAATRHVTTIITELKTASQVGK
jgi:flagellar basal-body rod protein FlgB